MYFLQFDTTPRRNARITPDAGGGVVACWIARSTPEEAIRVARAGIEAEGWIVGEPSEVRKVSADDYPPDHDGRDYFEQALIDREVWVFYTYPDSELDTHGG